MYPLAVSPVSQLATHPSSIHSLSKGIAISSLEANKYSHHSVIFKLLHTYTMIQACIRPMALCRRSLPTWQTTCHRWSLSDPAAGRVRSFSSSSDSYYATKQQAKDRRRELYEQKVARLERNKTRRVDRDRGGQGRAFRAFFIRKKVDEEVAVDCLKCQISQMHAELYQEGTGYAHFFRGLSFKRNARSM